MSSICYYNTYTITSVFFIEYIKNIIRKEKYIDKNEKYIEGMEDVANMYEKYFEEDL